jgi:DNA-binding response OmpR family regulator
MIVEPDPLARGVISGYLAESGFVTHPVVHGNLWYQVEAEAPRLLLLNVATTAVDALKFSEEFRARFDVPLILIGAREDDPVLLRGLMVGADDYVVKPVRKDTLQAKIRAHLRRYATHRQGDATVLRFRDITIDIAASTVRRNDQFIPLTHTEYRLLVKLARSGGKVCTSSELFEWLWRQPDGGDARSIQVHISNLRKKIEPNPSRPTYVLTVRGQGYKLAEPEPRVLHLA